MAEHDDERGRRSLRRDADVRSVSRVTLGVAAAAIAGTVVVGALAAGGPITQASRNGSKAAERTPAAADGGGTPVAEDTYVAPTSDPAYYYYDDETGQIQAVPAQPQQSDGYLQSPSSPPVQTYQPPVSGSGGS